MPKQTVAQISHSSLTDHRILARPGEPLPEIAYHMTTPEFPGLVFLDAIPQAAPTPVPPLTLFRAYAQLVQLDSAYAPGFDSEPAHERPKKHDRSQHQRAVEERFEIETRER